MIRALPVFATLLLLASPALASGSDGHAAPSARGAEAQAVAPGAHEATDQAGAHGHAEHFTWMSLVLDGHKQEAIKHEIAKVTPTTFIEKQPYETGGHLTHVFFSLIAFTLVLVGAIVVRGRLQKDADAGVLPARKFGVFMAYEFIIGAVWNLMRNMMGPDEARRHFPIVCTLAFYIFVMNAMALLPGGAPATDNLNTNIVMGVTVFLATHISGIRVQGPVGYLKHFAGPILALAPLMITIEIISHVVRPVSLSLRLLGNMFGDHKVMEIFLGFKVPLLPLPIMFLGLLVVCIQTLVFVLLSTVYLSMAVAHHEEHGDHAHDHH